MNHDQRCHSNYQSNFVQLILNLLSVYEGSIHNSDNQLKLQPPYLSQQIDCIWIRIHTFVIVFTCNFYHCNSPMVPNKFYFFSALYFTNKAITTVVTRQVSDQKIVWIWRNYFVNFSILTDSFKVLFLRRGISSMFIYHGESSRDFREHIVCK